MFLPDKYTKLFLETFVSGKYKSILEIPKFFRFFCGVC